MTAFPEGLLLLCSLHVRLNVKVKLRELGVTEGVQQIVVSDIFGRQIGDQVVEEVVDSESENEFKEGYDIISQKWTRMDAEESGPMHSFVTWFNRHMVEKTMLKSVCRKAGLGNPPTPFTTNVVLKYKTGCCIQVRMPP